MDVGLIGSYPPPHGGQSVHIQSLLRHLRSEGLDARVLNTGSNKAVREAAVVNIASARSLLSTLLLGPRFRLLHVHVSSADDYGKLVPVAIAARLRGSRWLATIHSGNSVDRLRKTTAPRRTASGAVLARADKIICVNSTIREGLSDLVRPASMVVIPPFSLDFRGSSLPPQLEQFFADHSPVLSCSGLYEPLYGFDQAVALMIRVREVYPNAGLLLIGDLKRSEWCLELISRLGLEKHVKPCGSLGHEECLAAIQRSMLFLRPTRHDGDSLSVREALALRVPVVASATDFRPEGVTLYRSGVLEDLAAKVLSVLDREGGDPARAGPANDKGYLHQIRQLYLEVMES